MTACVGAMLCFAGCNSVGDKPEDVVLEVLKKAQSGKADQEFLNKYCEGDTAKTFALMAEALKGATFTVAYSFVDDDLAVVKIKQEGGKYPGVSYYDAKKGSGHWKIKIHMRANKDYWCISQKTISQCVEAFKAVVKNEDTKFKEWCTKEFLGEFRDEFSKMPPNELEEMRKALDGIKIKGHEKKTMDGGDVIEVNCEMPHKDGRMGSLGILLKMVDGKWRVHKLN